jgi:hypothetical protein
MEFIIGVLVGLSMSFSWYWKSRRAHKITNTLANHHKKMQDYWYQQCQIERAIKKKENHEYPRPAEVRKEIR